jgi:CubicO group peptidase (beta-lactamase class C family)
VTPTLLDGPTVADAIRPQYPSLSGIVPGVGRYDRCPWGLGFEIRGDKTPHWTGRHNAASAHGHFGGAGTMFWIDPQADVALIALTDRDFDSWALEAWPTLSDAVIDEFAGAAA